MLQRMIPLLFLVSPGLSAFEMIYEQPLKLSESIAEALGPDLAVGSDGTVHTIFVEKAAIEKSGPHDHSARDELWYRSVGSDGQVGEPVRVNDETGRVWGKSVSTPVIDVGGDSTIHVLYPANGTHEDSGKGALLAVYTRSTDGGESFAPGRVLNSEAANDLSDIMHGGYAAAHAFGTLAAQGNSGVHAWWIDTRLMSEENLDGALYTAVSNDSGATFAEDSLVYADRVCPCCQLEAATTEDALWLTSRTVFDGGYRDPTVARADDAGYGERVSVSGTRWQIDGCPLKRTAVAVSGDAVFDAWYNGGAEEPGVFASASSDGGLSFGAEVQVHPGALVSDAPTLASNGRHALLVWHAKTEERPARRLYMRVSDDNGESWSELREVPTPEGISAYPVLAASEDGRFWLGWQQDDASAMLMALRPVELFGPMPAAGLPRAD